MVKRRQLVIAALALAVAMMLVLFWRGRSTSTSYESYGKCISQCNKAIPEQRAGCKAQCDAAPNLQRDDDSRDDNKPKGKKKGKKQRRENEDQGRGGGGSKPKKGKKGKATANYHLYPQNKGGDLDQAGTYCRGESLKEKARGAYWMAVDPSFFGGDMDSLCGKTFTVRGQAGSARVMIVDKRGGGIDLQFDAFNKICGKKGIDDGNCDVSW